MSICLRSVLGAVVFVLVCGGAWADVIIDDYEAGSLYLADNTPDSGTEYATEPGLDPARVAGGVRHYDLYGFRTPAIMEVASGDLRLLSSEWGGNYFNIIYNGNASSPGGTPNLNLNLSGMQHFALTFNRVDHQLTGHIRVRSGFATASYYIQPTVAGTIEAPLSGFIGGSINWADVDSVRIEVRSHRWYQSGGNSQAQSISDFRVVPEPAILGLSLAAGTCLLLRPRRAR